ncbi:37S ribosomal S19 mitochondrial [Pyrenophora seminiperda CCB06]|uniref:37S ribosomal S19 mitochondrial n=1 Tax=Pyrenophora seminiperda CCB06 TaxID=1302712 RepID=A0A3M7M3V9_9PLEO|nr:37S ribosomal S19 mitochondrial [Pyrenophora seminiperda CCB06]
MHSGVSLLLLLVIACRLTCIANTPLEPIPVGRLTRHGSKFATRFCLGQAVSVAPRSHVVFVKAIGSNVSYASTLRSIGLESLPIVQKKVGERVLPIKTQARSATILPNFVGLKFQIHDGKNYMDITITEDMVGHKLGEFAPTRKQFTYKQTKNK